MTTNSYNDQADGRPVQNPAAPPSTRTSSDSIRKTTIASMSGTVIEWFEFNLFGAMAALVLGPLFFPSDNELTSLLLSFATFGVAFIARPIGGILFGHFGDKYGRKRTLVAALLLMGIPTFAIGLLPTYATVGILAPILLVLARIMQGLALGGEYAGAALMVVEHRDATNRRGFFGAWIGSASPIGYILAASLIAGVSAGMSEDAFNSWGWRIPFLLSAVMVLVALYIRLQIEESSAFEKLATQRPETVEPTRIPFMILVREYPRQVFASIGANLAIQSGYYLAVIFGLSYARNQAGFSSTRSLILVLVAAVFYFFSILAAGRWSDRVGRRVPMTIGAIGFAGWGFAIFPLIDTGSSLLAGLAFTVALVLQGLIYGPVSAWMSELFGTEVRYTGVSFGYSIAAVIGGGITPVLSIWLLDKFDTTVPISAAVAAACAVTVVALAVTKLRVAHTDSAIT
ncbi:MHS family MFS transporter [Rhodococcus sp. BP-349]|uniref:MFS transporter n=1 Tax=unclassified Rhodococcus (in: high G+C Gram-positive bacteria) TaxID=192944 RepID=UPI001C9AE897|nr:MULTISPECIES: MFS transporter [unclassified Rhodococcus (in: high G+C Gram-positive bacteria)]MBY6538833.1 MHS family MFS transporter [Rhodococcus sp. BP-363]MBY6543170.1 MHS family MFS transporter [Rhodococcus sp. BP-369]MBY6562400.1 MHS family MFS transporter [Rhodococcus sp. BP-370]MBY6576692.1 MHS family MFS transporter [Rhodococcus sp. BP-364]MBY6585993.1 MHS family MFS transporter [Rhodococcus sp. BP-358]